MLERIRGRKETEFDPEIERVLFELNGEKMGTDDYSKRLVYLERLVELRQKVKPERISRDTYIVVGGGILQVMLIVFAEHNHVMISKAFSFVQKPKTRSITN
jgi:hypothetical protein